MSTVGQRERATQDRVVNLLNKQLGYQHLGKWAERPDNSNIEEFALRRFLKRQGYNDSLIVKALYELNKVAGDQTRSLYDINKAVYSLLRYGVPVKPDAGENTETVWLIDWKTPLNNDFALAEEVTVKSEHSKRPDVVLYVNGIALAVLELKRSIVSVSEGIRQNLDNQKKMFIQPFFTTIQLIMAGNDTEGLRYGVIETREKYYLTWKEESAIENLLDRSLIQLCEKQRLLEIVHDFVVFDAGVKKICRPNQYFGVRAAQERVGHREGGIIWHTQGSGKSLTMVWLARWIREHVKDARVLIITDRNELDEQIEKVFKGVNEEIYRTKSGQDLINRLKATTPWLFCSLIHKFGGKEESDFAGFIEEVKNSTPPDFKAKGDIYVFVDECHRTQSGDLHDAMKQLLPNAMFIGFTGTPLLKADKQKSIEVFGTNSRKVVRRNAALLPAYTLLLGLMALLGFMAIAAGIKLSPIYKANIALPALFAQMFPPWFAGFSFASLAIGALTPAAIMSIAASNLFTRNIYKEYFRPTCTEREESRVAKTVSLIIKLGALAFILLLPTTDVINFQLLGGIWIIQTLPAVFLGLYTPWFHRHALAIGLVGGLIVGTWMVVIQNFVSSVYTISFAGLHIPAYAAVSALVVNLVCCTGLTLLFRMLGISAGQDATRPADFEANPVLGSRSAALEAQIGRNAHADDMTNMTQESVMKRSR